MSCVGTWTVYHRRPLSEMLWTEAASGRVTQTQRLDGPLSLVRNRFIRPMRLVTRTRLSDKILAESASRALGGIISKFKMLKDCGYKTYTKLFDSGVLPILNYGAEIWGYGKHPKCDNILNRAMRYFLGVHKYAPTAAVQGDMGWISLKYRRYQAMLRFGTGW